MNQSKRKHESHQRPERGGKLAAAFRLPLHYPQGGVHSLGPLTIRHSVPLSISFGKYSRFTENHFLKTPATGTHETAGKSCSLEFRQ
jgi:hypothetical protein